MDWDDYFLGFVKGLGLVLLFGLLIVTLDIVAGKSLPKLDDPSQYS